MPFQSGSDRRNDLISSHQKLAQGDNDAISKLIDQNLYLLDKLSYLDNLFNQRLLTDLRKHITSLEREIEYLNHENTRLLHKLAITEDATKIMFLRLEGLKKDDSQNLPNYVASTLVKTGVNCSVYDLDSVRRIGKHKPGACRPTLIKFVKQSKRDLILYNRVNLNKGAPDSDLLWLNDDVSVITRRNRKIVRDVASHAKDMGIDDIKVHGDGIVLGNKKIKHYDLDLLPPLLTASNASNAKAY